MIAHVWVCFSLQTWYAHRISSKSVVRLNVEFFFNSYFSSVYYSRRILYALIGDVRADLSLLGDVYYFPFPILRKHSSCNRDISGLIKQRNWMMNGWWWKFTSYRNWALFKNQMKWNFVPNWDSNLEPWQFSSSRGDL